jgi:lipopolysaccharide exporter
MRAAAVGASYLVHPFRPRPSLRNARDLFAFSSGLLLNNLIEYGRMKFGDIYIGRVYGPATNGIFAVAGEISITPRQLSRPLLSQGPLGPI